MAEALDTPAGTISMYVGLDCITAISPGKAAAISAMTAAVCAGVSATTRSFGTPSVRAKRPFSPTALPAIPDAVR